MKVAIDQNQAKEFTSTFSEEYVLEETTGQIIQIFKEAEKNGWEIEISDARDQKNFKALFKDAFKLNAFISEMNFQNGRVLSSAKTLPKASTGEDLMLDPIVWKFPQEVQDKLDFGRENSQNIDMTKKVDQLARDLILEILSQIAVRNMEARKLEREKLRGKTQQEGVVVQQEKIGDNTASKEGSLRAAVGVDQRTEEIRFDFAAEKGTETDVSLGENQRIAAKINRAFEEKDFLSGKDLKNAEILFKDKDGLISFFQSVNLLKDDELPKEMKKTSEKTIRSFAQKVGIQLDFGKKRTNAWVVILWLFSWISAVGAALNERVENLAEELIDRMDKEAEKKQQQETARKEIRGLIKAIKAQTATQAAAAALADNEYVRV